MHVSISIEMRRAADRDRHVTGAHAPIGVDATEHPPLQRDEMVIDMMDYDNTRSA
jgi:hypothetical protein